jgi:hypothetical protein
VTGARRSSGQHEEWGQLWLCPICVNARGLEGQEMVAHVTIAGATPMWALGRRVT